jgi:hypothetical protein
MHDNIFRVPIYVDIAFLDAASESLNDDTLIIYENGGVAPMGEDLILAGESQILPKADERSVHSG